MRTVSIDFHHEVFFYRDGDEFLAGTVPYLLDAVEAGEPALIAVGSARAAALRAELGGAAEQVRFAEIEEIGRNPARIIPFWHEFLDEYGGRDRPIRGIGEPVWPGRNAHELDECRRHESLLNVAFDDLPGWSLLCPYDAGRLTDEVLEAAQRSHPFVAGSAGPNGAWVAAESKDGTFAGSLSARPARALPLAFDRDGLVAVRDLVARQARIAGLGPDRASDLVAAASELAANSVAHGGGHGTIWTWAEAGDLVVEVADEGLIDEPLVGRRRPSPAQDRGRGLWISNLFCDLVQIRSGDGGTAVRLRVGLSR